MTATEIKDILEIVALLGIAYNVGSKLAEMSTHLKQMADTFKAWADLPERVAVLESRVDGHEETFRDMR